MIGAIYGINAFFALDRYSPEEMSRDSDNFKECMELLFDVETTIDFLRKNPHLRGLWPEVRDEFIQEIEMRVPGFRRKIDVARALIANADSANGD
jgi:hypothetical protein